jgi:hypothetical protein
LGRAELHEVKCKLSGQSDLNQTRLNTPWCLNIPQIV